MWCLVAKERTAKELRDHVHFADDAYQDMVMEEQWLCWLGLYVIVQQKCCNPIKEPTNWIKTY